MNKKEFIQEMKQLLADIPEKEIKDILYDYEEHFLMGLENGKTEEEIAQSLGQPKTIAKELRVQYHITQAEADKSITNITRAIIASISLGFFNLVFVLGPFIALLGVLISFYAVSFSLIVAPIGLLFSSSLNWFSTDFLTIIFASMLLIGLGVLLGVAMIYVTKWAYQVFIRYLQFNITIIKGK